MARPGNGLHLRVFCGKDATLEARSWPSSITSAASCACVPAIAWSMRVAAGAHWRCVPRTHYGARVRAFSLSREQIAYARERARALGVSTASSSSKTTIATFPASSMLRLDRHARARGPRPLWRSRARHRPQPVRDGPRVDTQHRPERGGAVDPWIEKRIFPGAYPPTLREMVEIFEPLRCSILDVENLRPHYALTIEHWLDRFEAHRDRIADMYDEPFVRAWRLYLCGSIAAFRAGTLQLFQILFNRAGSNNAAWTRDHLSRNPD